MRIKDDSVSLLGMQPQVMIALIVANEVYGLYGSEAVITSGSDGNHSSTSLHYSGNAVDIRVWNLPSEVIRGKVRDQIKERLNKDFDVVLEATHIHIEYQPRK